MACSTSSMPLQRALTRPAHATVAVVPCVELLWDTPEETLLDLSERLRMAGAAALLLRNPSLRQVQLVLEEQRSASGNFPSPIPVFCEPHGDDYSDAPPTAASGAAALVLPCGAAATAAWTEPLVVPRCTTTTDLDAALALPSPPPLLFASDEAVPPLLSAVAEDDSNRAKPLVMASLALGPDCASEARALRAAGCSAVVVDFAADNWPAPPEAVVRAVLSGQSTTFNSLGLKVGFGDFSSDQYWLNRKFKEARAIQKKRYDKEGPPSGGGGDDAPAGSQVGL